MPESSDAVLPLQALREQITALKAAITLALADPKKKPVHQLRTGTRRIEAQIALLSLLTPTITHVGPAKKVSRLLKKLRQAAGEVRDLDVQRDLLKQPRELQTALAPPGPTENLEETATLGRRVVRDARSLRKTLKHRRSAAAADLVRLLNHHQLDLTRLLESLLDALAPTEQTGPLTLPPTRLVNLTEDWYTGHLPPLSEADFGAEADPNHLHSVRKVAKLARYMAESSVAAADLAHTFEELQQAGGTWHDFLELRTIARHELGRRSPLTSLLTHLTDSSLQRFQARLPAAPAGASDGPSAQPRNKRGPGRERTLAPSPTLVATGS